MEILTKSYSVIDNETGEIVKVFNKKSSKEEIIKERYLKNPSKENLLMPWRTNAFTKLYSSEDLPNYESEKYLIYWIKLSKRLSESTNIIVNKGRTSKQDIPMTKDDMVSYLGITERTLRDFLKESLEKNIMVKNTIEGDITREQYVMNPLYTFNGKNINYYTFELFKHDEVFMGKVTQTMLSHYHYINQNVLTESSQHSTESSFRDIESL